MAEYRFVTTKYIMNFAFSVALVVSSCLFAYGERENLRAADRWHESNKRGFIGCRDGVLVIEHFDIGDTGSWTVFNLPDHNPCHEITH